MDNIIIKLSIKGFFKKHVEASVTIDNVTHYYYTFNALRNKLEDHQVKKCEIFNIHMYAEELQNKIWFKKYDFFGEC